MKPLIITTISFFIIVNTQYYWGPFVGIFHLIVLLFLFLTLIALTVVFIYHLIKSIKDKFRTKQRNILLICLIFTLGTTLYKPMGIIDFDRFYGADKLIAQREGAANCMTVLKLKERGNLIESSFCFGESRKNGSYLIENDTIWFTNYDEYAFGLISKNGKNEVINLYKNQFDTIPMFLFVTQNDL